MKRYLPAQKRLIFILFFTHIASVSASMTTERLRHRCFVFTVRIHCKYFIFQAETIFLNRDLEERKEEEEEEKLCWLEACYRALELHRKNTDVLVRNYGWWEYGKTVLCIE